MLGVSDYAYGYRLEVRVRDKDKGHSLGVRMGVWVPDRISVKVMVKILGIRGIPGWHSGLMPAFGPGRDPGDPGSNPTSGSWCMEPASPSAYVSASLSFSLCDYHK